MNNKLHLARIKSSKKDKPRKNIFMVKKNTVFATKKRRTFVRMQTDKRRKKRFATQ